jgi:predicted N-acetyltransferase YhbS
MKIRALKPEDVENISALNPEGWGDITPYFRFYMANPACHPFVAEDGGRVIGSGNYNYQGEIAWLSHIIVAPEYRKQGIGKAITEFLVSELKKKACKSVMLIATPMGEPVYKKVGFQTLSKYIFLKGPKLNYSASDGIRPFQKTDMPALLELDLEVTGENRYHLLGHQTEGWVVFRGSDLIGFYLPKLWGGPVIAKYPEAGKALLGIRMKEKEAIVLPEQNLLGTGFLMDHGFKEFHEPGMRMYLGENLHWQPSKIFGRIDGAFG